ncbi:MAG: transposase [Acidobacteriia bacterium]|nr:transposase [Terriglobia bacterium]
MGFLHRNIRLPAAKYRGVQWYFVTLCCAGRRRVFADEKRATWIVDELRRHATSHRFAVHAYCAMPDHLHALVMGLDATSDLLTFLKNLKQKTAYEFHSEFDRSLWQKKFYDHILRREDAVERVAAYIWMNPVRKGLCKDPREYAFSGSFVLDWKRDGKPVETWVPPWKEKAPATKATTGRQE